MKKFLLSIITLIFVSTAAFADNAAEALLFFKNYVAAANSYSDSVATMYSPSAKIIRQVVKPDGTTANAYTDTATYLRQMKIGQAGAKLRNYTNSYSNITVTPITETKYKISSLRQPKGETYKLKTYMIIQKQPNGKWLIVEEMMQTKMQIFLKYVKS
ncbi:hypothetical protein IJ750_03940 [bacterium]|nr:hypothetical protein [bacterium]